MTCSSFQHFWSDIVWRTTNRSFLFTIEIELSGKTKVSQFDLHFVIQKQIAKFEITMNNSVRMEVLERRDDLEGVVFDLEFMKTLPSFE